MIRISSRKTINSLKKLEKNIVKAAGAALKDATNVAYKDIKTTQTYKNRTGDTRRSLEQQVNKSLLRSSIKQAGATIFLENGTRAHGPVSAQYMVFFSRGKTWYLKWVSGITGRHFMEHGRQVGEKSLRFLLNYYVGNEIKYRG